jgi:hypothetical protein
MQPLGTMDARVKPGHDDRKISAPLAFLETN